MTRLTDGEIEIVAEIQDDCAHEWEHDAMLAAVFELDLPCERCGRPATGFGYGVVTCDEHARIVAAEWMAERGHEPIDTTGDLDDVLFPF